MKNDRSIYGFLIEFLIMISIFAVVSIVTVTLFSRADILDRRTENLNQGLLECENVAEKMKSYSGEDIDEYLDGFDLENIIVNIDIENGRETFYISDITYVEGDETLIEFKVASFGGESDE